MSTSVPLFKYPSFVSILSFGLIFHVNGFPSFSFNLSFFIMHFLILVLSYILYFAFFSFISPSVPTLISSLVSSAILSYAFTNPIPEANTVAALSMIIPNKTLTEIPLRSLLCCR